MNVSGLPTLRQFAAGPERVYHLQDGGAYRTLCERLHASGYDFPQCLSGQDTEYGLRSVLHLRRLDTGAEVTVWLDLPYERPHAPSVADLWGGVEWHEREAYDLLGIHYDGHPDLRRILLEDHWSIHPLQKRYDTGGYLIPEWQPQPWPDWEAQDREKEEAARKEAEAKAAREARAAAVQAPTQGSLTDVRALNANYAGKLQEQGVTSIVELAALTDEQLEPLAAAIGLKSAAAVRKWREGAQALLQEQKQAPAPETAATDDADLTRIRALNANYAAKLREQGVTTLRALAALGDEEMAALAANIGLKSPAAVKKWRDGAKELLDGDTP